MEAEEEAVEEEALVAAVVAAEVVAVVKLPKEKRLPDREIALLWWELGL